MAQRKKPAPKKPRGVSHNDFPGPRKPAPKPAPKAAAPAPPPLPMDTTEGRNNYTYLQKLFESYGLGTLAPVILGYVQQGYSSDTISLLLQDTPEYKQRFSANDARRQAGLPVLSPAEYLGLEGQYRQILSSAGLPAGFYDSPQDFNSWIAGDVSPNEIAGRVQVAQKWVNNTDPAARQALSQFYNIGDQDLVAYALDRSRAEPLLEKQANAATIGAAAIHQGLGISRDRAEHFADLGAANNAEQAFSTIGQILPTATKLGSIYHDAYSQNDAEDEVLGGLASAQRKRQHLVDQEVGSFSGGIGVGRQSLGRGTHGRY